MHKPSPALPQVRRPRAGPLLAAGLALWLGACATAPAPSGPAATALPAGSLAAAWTQAEPGGAADEAALARWWRGLDDPLLAALVDEALAANPDLRSAQAALARARALRDLAAAGQSPQLGSSASASRNRSAGRQANSLSLGLDASWEADVFGARAQAVAAAQAQAEASAATLAATRLSLAGEVALAYLQWHGLRSQAALAEENLALQEESLSLARWRAGAGLVTELDVEQARGSVEQSRARRATLQASQVQAEHRLAVALGRAPGSLGPRLATATAAPGLPAVPAPGLPGDLLRRRPDVQAAEWTVRAALATLAQREAERRPQFGISGRLGLQAATLAALGGGSAVVAALGASVSWPVLDGGAGRAQVAAQQAALDGARASYQAAVLAAQQDVEDMLVALRQGQAQVQHLAQSAAAAREVLRLQRLRYQAGTVDFGALLDAQRSAVNADDALATARTDLALNQVRLYKGLGGGWSADDRTPAP